MPAFSPYATEPLLSGVNYDPKDVSKGAALYGSYCGNCHGVPGVDNGGAIVNLGHIKRELIVNLDQTLVNGPMTYLGMPDFSGKFTAKQIDELKAYIQSVPDSMRAK
jgi:quinohemoprotein ethanol dehydrogenase